MLSSKTYLLLILLKNMLKNSNLKNPSILICWKLNFLHIKVSTNNLLQHSLKQGRQMKQFNYLSNWKSLTKPKDSSKLVELQIKKQSKPFQTFISNKLNGQELTVTGNKLDNFIWPAKITRKPLIFTQKKTTFKDWLKSAVLLKGMETNKL